MLNVRRSVAERKRLAAEYGHWNYITFFDNGRMKVGVSKNPRERFTRYVQECRRHGLGEVRMNALGGMFSRGEVLLVETRMCKVMAPFAVSSSREWFECDEDMVLAALKMTRDLQNAMLLQNWRVQRPIPDSTSVDLFSWRQGYAVPANDDDCEVEQ